MQSTERLVVVTLTTAEADEILMRCLQSREQDNVVFDRAIARLARALESSADPENSSAAA